MNSHELHTETGRWTVPKTAWVERICHLCENRNIEDENRFLLECPAYMHIRYYIISQILDLTLIGMSLLIMMLSWCFILIYWVEDPTAYEHDDLICKLGISQLLMTHTHIYIYIYMLVVFGVDPEAHNRWYVLCWARGFGEHEYIHLCWS